MIENRSDADRQRTNRLRSGAQNDQCPRGICGEDRNAAEEEEEEEENARRQSEHAQHAEGHSDERETNDLPQMETCTRLNASNS